MLERVTPPKIFLKQLDLPTDWTYTFSGMQMPLIAEIPPLSEIPLDEHLSEF